MCHAIQADNSAVSGKLDLPAIYDYLRADFPVPAGADSYDAVFRQQRIAYPPYLQHANVHGETGAARVGL